MKLEFKKDNSIEKTIKLIIKDNSFLKKLSIEELEILSNYLSDYKNYLSQNKGV